MQGRWLVVGESHGGKDRILLSWFDRKELSYLHLFVAFSRILVAFSLPLYSSFHYTHILSWYTSVHLFSSAVFCDTNKNHRVIQHMKEIHESSQKST